MFVDILEITSKELAEVDKTIQSVTGQEYSLLQRLSIGATPASLEHLTNPANGLPVYGTLKAGEFSNIEDRIKKDLLFFQQMCGIGFEEPRAQVNQEFLTHENRALVDAVTYWYLKTGESLAQLVEQIVYMNEATHRRDWFSKDNEPEIRRSGSLTCLVGMPAVGKSFVASLLRKLPEVLVIDTDAFRAAIFGKKILSIDEDLLNASGADTWQKKQYLYSSAINNVFRITVKAVAGMLSRRGYDVITTGMAASSEAQKLVYIETEQLPLAKLLEHVRTKEFPSRQLLADMTSNNESIPEGFFIERGFPIFENAFQRVRNRVIDRVALEPTIGLLDYTSDMEVIIVNQIFGMNPRMNDRDIAGVLCGVAHDVDDFYSNDIDVVTLRHEDVIAGISPDSRDEFEAKLPSYFGLNIDASTRSEFLPWVAPEIIANPTDVLEHRTQLVAAANEFLEGLCAGIEQLIAQNKKSKGDEQTSDLLIHEAAQSFIQSSIDSLLTQSDSLAPYQEFWKKLPKGTEAEAKLLRDGLSFILFRNLRSVETTEDGVPKFSWPLRYDPSLGKRISALVHSAFTLPGLGQYYFPNSFSVLDLMFAIFHDGLEEATYQPENDHGILEPQLYGDTDEGREVLGSAISDRFQELAPMLNAASRVLTEQRTPEHFRKLLINAWHLELLPEFQSFCDVQNGDLLDSKQRRRIFSTGPAAFGLVALQEREAVVKLAEFAENLPSEQRDSILKVARGLLEIGILDRYDDILTLERYITPYEGQEFDGKTGRIKILTYTGRLLNTFGKLTEALNALPREQQQDFAKVFRDYIPTMHKVITERVNPRLVEAGEAPLTDIEIHNFFRLQYQPYMNLLEEELLADARNVVDESLAPIFDMVDYASPV